MKRRKTGGGSRKGKPNKATAEIREAARSYAPAAIKELARLATHAESETVRVMAIDKLLDRAYGKPVQMVVGDEENPLAMVVRWAQLETEATLDPSRK
jgi:hypothetical protein